MILHDADVRRTAFLLVTVMDAENRLSAQISEV